MQKEIEIKIQLKDKENIVKKVKKNWEAKKENHIPKLLMASFLIIQ